MREALDLLKPLLESPAVLKVAQNMKYDLLVLSRPMVSMSRRLMTQSCCPMLWMAGRSKHGMDALSQSILGHTPIPFKEVCRIGQVHGDIRQGAHRQGHRLCG